MKKFLHYLLPALLLVAGVAQAATALTVNWVLPTVAVDGTALTGAQALTKVQVFVSTSTIPDTSTAAPTVELTATSTQTTQTVAASPGQSVFVRLKACNSAGCSAFTSEVSKSVPVSVPGVPTTVTITISTS